MKLKTSNIDPGNDALPQIKKVVLRLKEKWPEVQIINRGDSGFCRENIMSWIEKQEGVFFLFGLARNKRLCKRMSGCLAKAKDVYKQTYKKKSDFQRFYI